jgi:hypothetical protein
MSYIHPPQHDVEFLPMYLHKGGVPLEVGTYDDVELTKLFLLK